MDRPKPPHVAHIAFRLMPDRWRPALPDPSDTTALLEALAGFGPVFGMRLGRRPARLVPGLSSVFWTWRGAAFMRTPVMRVRQSASPGGPCVLGCCTAAALVEPKPVRLARGWRYVEAADAPRAA